MAQNITKKSDLSPLPVDAVNSLFRTSYVNLADGTNYLDDPIVMEYTQYFPSISLKYDPVDKVLVPCGTVPEMAILTDGHDQRKGMLSSKVKEAELRIIASQGNTNFYKLNELYDVLSSVGTRGGTGKAALREQHLAKLLEGIQEQLATMFEFLGTSAQEFDTLFNKDGALNIADMIAQAYEEADAEYAEKKEARKAANEESEDEEE